MRNARTTVVCACGLSLTLESPFRGDLFLFWQRGVSRTLLKYLVPLKNDDLLPLSVQRDVTLYVNNTGLMWENAEQFGALLVFAE